MGLERQNIQMRLAFPEEDRSEAPRAPGEGTEGSMAVCVPESPAVGESLMEEVCERENLKQALKRVRANRGSPGVDGMKVQELLGYLKEHWPDIREQLLQGTYKPQPVRGVEIPKPGGGVRQLGIPTVVDRLVQQGILQVLEPLLDPTFSESSYGFRPRRNAHQALRQAQEYVAEGREIVVDLDLEKFFDRVNHDILMSRLARRVADKRLLRIVRRFLKAGMMQNGVCVRRYEGTPQGSHYRRSCAICYWTTWTRSWNAGATASAGTPMTATYTCGRRRQGNG